MKLKKKSLRLKYPHLHATLRTFLNIRLIRIFAIHIDQHKIYHTYSHVHVNEMFVRTLWNPERTAVVTRDFIRHTIRLGVGCYHCVNWRPFHKTNIHIHSLLMKSSNVIVEQVMFHIFFYLNKVELLIYNASW